MKATYIDYKDTASFSSTVIRYLEQDPQLQPFISYPPTVEGFRQIMANKNPTANRSLLIDILRQQYSQLPKSQNSKVQTNIDLLLSENTFTVTTGHQLNIFTGPLYFIFKIATAIKLAADLKQQIPDKDFVPVYWMASEDHDFEEINHTHIGGKKIVWYNEASGATGRLHPSTIRQALAEYKGILGLSDHATDLSDLIDAAYQNHSTLADATRYLVNGLFENYGLVIIDADHPDLKKQFAPVVQSDIVSQHSHRTILSAIEKLKEAGVEAQVNPREINFFYILDNLRERLVYQNDRYFVLNSDISFDKTELEQEVHAHPERFSPNVVMRPLYQEMILPNIAYIGGGAEIVYWLQLKSTFDEYHVDFPALILRNSALLAAEHLEHKLNRLDLGYHDLFTSLEKIKNEWISKHSANSLDLDAEWEELQATFGKIKEKAEIIDRTLAPSSEAVKARLHHAISNLEKKFLKAEKRNYSTSLKQIEALKDQYFPNGSLQERSENFGLFYSKYGQEFINELIRHFKPLEFKFTVLEPEEKH